MDRGAWWATVQSIAESDMTEVTHHVLTMPKYELVFPPRHKLLMGRNEPYICFVSWSSSLLPASVQHVLSKDFMQWMKG